MKKLGVLTAGIFKENPVFVLMLGLCPTLGVTSSAINGFSMGLAVIAVLACSNGLISLFKKFIPDEVRIPAFIMIIASLVTVVDMVMNAYTPDLYKVLGIFTCPNHNCASHREPVKSQFNVHHQSVGKPKLKCYYCEKIFPFDGFISQD